ncbi:lipocalin/fatty-acid binding family protein [Kitasatospora sp. NPDC056076]|uniref:lipocalin/fatty-acid binding family protein n=1 Tax=Kitasatospora sp. NPDC056076 TaxID=3345703 RepID=UPI0035D75292
MAGGAFTDFSGTYDLVSSEGYEKYLESVKVDAATREVLTADPQTVKITQEGDHYTFRNTVATKESILQFTLGQEFVADFGYGDDRRAKGIARRDFNHLTLQWKAGTTEATVRFTADDEGLLDVVFAGPNATTATRRYKRQP